MRGIVWSPGKNREIKGLRAMLDRESAAVFRSIIYFSGIRRDARCEPSCGRLRKAATMRRITMDHLGPSEVLYTSLGYGDSTPAGKPAGIHNKTCTRTEVLFRGSGVGLRKWRMRADKVR